jgi:hypothetical protein
MTPTEDYSADNSNGFAERALRNSVLSFIFISFVFSFPCPQDEQKQK